VTKAFASNDEQSLLSEFFSLLSEFPQYILCGHNIKEFDIPYTCRRGVVHGLKLPGQLMIRDSKPREIPHKDTMEMRKYGDRKAYTSLVLLCGLFGIETPKDDIDGSQVSSVYRDDHDLPRIVEYCTKDVIATAKVYERLQ
jgi:DNA polymerase elongation subunit (family B)